VWKQRTAPKVVKVQPISRERQEEERKSKESEEEKSASPSAPAASLPSPYQQYIEQKVRAVQMQQVCDRLHQRVNAVADQQRLRQWSARM
jgi:hypothetical protein